MFGWLRKLLGTPEPGHAFASLVGRAQSLSSSGDSEGALLAFKEAESLARRAGLPPESLLIALVGKATILDQRDDLVAAAAFYHEAEDLARRHGDDECFSSCSERLAVIRRRVDNLDRALELHRRHRWDWRESGDPAVLSASLANQGVALASAGKYAEALAVLERLEQVCREWPSFPGVAIALKHQAEIYAACGDHAKAAALTEERDRLTGYTAADFPYPESVPGRAPRGSTAGPVPFAVISPSEAGEDELREIGRRLKTWQEADPHVTEIIGLEQMLAGQPPETPAWHFMLPMPPRPKRWHSCSSLERPPPRPPPGSWRPGCAGARSACWLAQTTTAPSTVEVVAPNQVSK
jgi:tetratricopeptide (TPR) repeat protein